MFLRIEGLKKTGKNTWQVCDRKRMLECDEVAWKSNAGKNWTFELFKKRKQIAVIEAISKPGKYHENFYILNNSGEVIEHF